MNTLDKNVFTCVICPLLTGKIIDDIMLVNKEYNTILKNDMKHLRGLFWTVEETTDIHFYIKRKRVLKDWKKEGEQLAWYSRVGHLESKLFYKEGKLEGEQLRWYRNGPLLYKSFYKEGKFEGEQESWYRNGQLATKHFYKDKKLEGEQLSWWKNGELSLEEFYKDGNKQ